MPNYKWVPTEVADDEGESIFDGDGRKIANVSLTPAKTHYIFHAVNNMGIREYRFANTKEFAKEEAIAILEGDLNILGC